MGRKYPNILVTGTPGTGKTTLCELIALATNMEHIELSKAVKENSWYTSYDDEYQCYVIDEDKVCDELESKMKEGGIIIDIHSSGFFPERWFDLIVVLRTDNTILYDRLAQRNYSQKKITENVEAEIMQVILEETEESYKKELILILDSNTTLDMDKNVGKIQKYYDDFISDLKLKKKKSK